MFITNKRSGYDRLGEQVASGLFLVLMTCSEAAGTLDAGRLKIRGIVRHVSYHQLGQFMMGRVRIAGHSITLSGAYGGDGLTRDVPEAVFMKGTPLPDELYDAWKNGGGWNSSGSEGPAMHAWALDLVKAKEEAQRPKPYREPTGKMSAKAARDYYQHLRGEAASFARRVIKDQVPFSVMLTMWHDGVCGGPRWKRAPRWVHDAMRGWSECFHNEIYTRHTEWRVWLDGKHVSGKDMPKGRWSDVDGDKGATVWTSTGKVWHGYDPSVPVETKVAQA